MINKKILIMAGGSGGHVFPGITIALHLIKKGWKVHWMGTENHIECSIVPKFGITIDFISIHGFHKQQIKTLILTPFRLIKAYLQAKTIISKYKPHIILGMGGYVSAPGGIVAYQKKIPLILHEQNKVAGLTNKILSYLSTKNLQAFSNTLINAKLVGNPIRTELLNIPSPYYRFNNRQGPIRILVLGGSQGSQFINAIIPKIILEFNSKILIWHQTGKNITKDIKNFYSVKRNNVYKTSVFINDMKFAYSWADLVISRGGAITVSEITAIGLAAIFIPYPHKDKQQYWNTLHLQQSGAAKIFKQEYINITLIIQLIKTLNRKKLIIMAKKSFSIIHHNSTQVITNIIEQTLKYK